jgi:curved DNA-binding protein CbpA
MSVCGCGRITNEGRPACDLCTALALFGLTRQATQAEIKDAYRVLAKVWHPDRFPGDEDLRRTAEEKLKEINSAYQLLNTTAARETYSDPARPGPRPEAHQGSAAAAPNRNPYNQPSSGPGDGPYRTKRRATKKLLAFVVAILATGGIWITLRYVHPVVWDFGGATRQTGGLVTDTSHADATGKGAVRDGASGQASKENQAANDSAGPADKKAAHTRSNAVSSDRASLVVYPDEDPQVPYFTVGSTRNDVIRVQGTPDRMTGNVFGYGLSEVYFKNGRVESWRTDPSSPLRARMPQE